MTTLAGALVLILVPTLPLALLALACVPGLRQRVARLVPWAALPALLLGLVGEPVDDVALRWILLGSVLGLDLHTRVFLALTALLWLAASLHARGYLRDDARRDRFNVLWLATMAGNFGLIVARDVATFYAAFALMTFAAYGLVIHTGSREALRAGRVYLTMAVLGEGLIAAGLLLAASLIKTPLTPMLAQLAPAIAVAPQRDLIIACLWLGFGIKAGLPLLHMWLPLAHPVAPVPASAVLSGAMIKAGLLGWLNTLPLGLASLPAWGTLVMVTGLVATFGAALIGIQQHSAKTVLAYSSVSQMGLITVGVGAGLVEPALWPLLAPAVVFYALHHGLAKGALFLGVAVAHHPGRHVSSPLLWLALALPGLSLAGLMTSGTLAKLGLKEALAAASAAPTWWTALPVLLGFAAVGTTGLVARYLWLLRVEQASAADARAAAHAPEDAIRTDQTNDGAGAAYGHRGRDTEAHDQGNHRNAPAALPVWLGWALAVGASTFAFVLVPRFDTHNAVGTADLVTLAWPVIVGTAMSIAAWRWLRAWPVPAGDLIVWLAAAAHAACRATTRLQAPPWPLVGKAAAAMAALQIAAPRHGRRWSARSSLLEQLWRREAALVFAALLVLMLVLSLGALP